MSDIENKILFDKSCRLPVYVMRNLGIDILDNVRWRPYFRWLRFYPIIIIFCGLVFSCLSIRSIIEFKQANHKDYTVITKVITNFIYVLGGTLKIAYILRQSKKLQDLLNQIRQIFPKSKKERGINVEPMSTYFWSKWITFVTYSFFIISSFLCFHSPFTSIIVYCYRLLTRSKNEAQFPYLRSSLVRLTSNDRQPLVYFVMTIIEYICGHGGISINCIDLWAITFVMHLSMHYDDLNTGLLHHRPMDTIKLSKIDQKFIANFVEKHTLLLKISKEVADTFNFTHLINISYLTCYIIGASIFVLSHSELDSDMVYFAIFVVFNSGQLFVICYYSQMLYIKSLSVGDCIYNHTWYNAPLSYRKLMLIIMMRAQKPCVFNAGGFLPLTYLAFTTIMSLTYRTIAVFNTLLE